MKTQYLSLEALAAVLGLPQNYLRQLAKQKRIPSLKVGGRMRFQESEVREALVKIARNTKPAKDLQRELSAIVASTKIYNAGNKMAKINDG